MTVYRFVQTPSGIYIADAFQPAFPEDRNFRPTFQVKRVAADAAVSTPPASYSRAEVPDRLASDRLERQRVRSHIPTLSGSEMVPYFPVLMGPGKAHGQDQLERRRRGAATEALSLELASTPSPMSHMAGREPTNEPPGTPNDTPPGRCRVGRAVALTRAIARAGREYFHHPTRPLILKALIFQQVNWPHGIAVYTSSSLELTSPVRPPAPSPVPSCP